MTVNIDYMFRSLIIVFFISLFTSQVVQAQLHLREKKVHKNSIPKEVVDYTEKNYKGKSAKYYELITDNDSLFFEAKVKSDQGRVNVIFDSTGQFVRVDNTIHFLDISEDVRKVIKSSVR